MMLIAGCLSQDEVQLSLGSSMPLLEPQDRARAHYLRHNGRNAVRGRCQGRGRLRCGIWLRVRKVRTGLYLVSIICIVSACAGEFTMCQAWYMSKVYATALA